MGIFFYVALKGFKINERVCCICCHIESKDPLPMI